MLHAFDVENPSVVIESAVSTPSAEATASPAEVIDAAASSSAPEASTTPSSDTSQTSSAFATFPGLAAAVLISAVATVAQIM